MVKLANMQNPGVSTRRLLKAKKGQKFNLQQHNKKRAKALKEWKEWF